MQNALAVVFALLLTALTCSAQQGSVKANIIASDGPSNPPGKYFNINKGNADGLMEGDVLTVKRLFRGQELDIAKVKIAAVTQSWARVGRLSEDSGKRILDTDFLVRDSVHDTISFVAQNGHSRPVNIIAFSTDGKLIASGALDGSLKIWESSSKHVLLTMQVVEPVFFGPQLTAVTGDYPVPRETISAISFSPDSKLIATGTAVEENNLKLWDVAKGKAVATLMDTERTNGPLFGPSVRRSDSPVIQWRNAIKTVKFSPDGRFVAAGIPRDACVKVWNVRSRSLEKKLQLPSVDGAGDFAFSSDGKKLAASYTVDGRQFVTLWNVNSWESEGDFSGDIELGSELLSSRGYPYLVAVAAKSGEVALLDWKTKRVIRKTGVGSPCEFQSSLGGNGLIATVNGGSVRISGLDSNQDAKVFAVDQRPPIRVKRSQRPTIEDWDPNPPDGPDTFVIGPHKIVPVSLSPSGRWLVWGRFDGTITIWDTNDKDAPAQMADSAPTIKSFAAAKDTAFEEDLLATAVSNGQIYLWSLRSGSLIKTFRGFNQGAQSISFSADGTKLSGSYQFEVDTWEIATGKVSTWVVNDENASRRRVMASGMNSARDILALGRNDGYVDVWDTKTHTFIGRAGDLEPGAIGTRTGPGFIDKVVVANSSDLVAFQKEGGAFDVWNFRIPKKIVQDRCTGPLAFSPDDRYVACGLGSQPIVWDIANNLKPRRMDSFETVVTSLAFSSDGSKIFGGARDALVVWNLQSGEIESVHRDDTRAVGLSVFGNSAVVSVNQDSTIAIYSAQNPKLLAKAIGWERSDWLSFTPDGFFDGTSRAWKQLIFHSEAEPLATFELERFFSQFYQTNLISNVIAEGRPMREILASRDDRRASMNLEPLKRSKLPVVIFPALPAKDREITERLITLKVSALDEGSGVQDCRVFRNDVLVYSDRQSLRNQGSLLNFEMKLTVMAGPNKISAYCFNNDGLKSKDKELTFRGANSLYRKGKAYVLAIGINDYAGSVLYYAKDDAVQVGQNLSEMLSTTHLFDVVPPIVLLDTEAKKANILWALKTFGGDENHEPPPLKKLQAATKLQPEDALIVYFAGHGLAQNEHYYLLPHDYRQKISEEDLEGSLQTIDATHLALIIDSCQSGTLLSSMVRTGPIDTRGLAQIAFEKGAYILVASQGDQPAREFKELKHGLMTSVLLNDAYQILTRSAPSNAIVYMQPWLTLAVEEVPIVHSKLAETLAIRSEEVKFPKPGEDPRAYWYQVPALYYRSEEDKNEFPLARTQ
jgi:WD40 repeat protein